ncbi:hypothetical protein M0805_002760 [Coniferiporia weirii]|nr:hypothetical protein M0805_002760 [Coniferiporia weirii]
MNGAQETAISPDFKWDPEYDSLLEKIATSDYVESDWSKLRDMIKYKLNENIASYMSDPPPPAPPPPPPAEPPTNSPDSTKTVTASPKVLTAVGAKFPPFPRREVNEFVRNEYNSHGRSTTVLTEEEAKRINGEICKLLHDFDGNPPFTIQRVCELTIRPRTHYKSAGKYLRAFERALLVTSTIDAFPVIPPEDPDASPSAFIPTGSLLEAKTPLFSPIPFLHEDARRSRSRSPPMSPLQLATSQVRQLSPEADELRLGTAGSGEPVVGGQAIGLVDELDDPNPGHMSEHPTALSATTSTAPEAAAAPTAEPAPRPIFGGSLMERFVKSSETVGVPGGSGGLNAGEAMAVDEPDEDKENVPKP